MDISPQFCSCNQTIILTVSCDLESVYEEEGDAEAYANSLQLCQCFVMR